jgi:4-hydroxy-4-methyl-2-oxoglutarate aldolase
MIDHSSADMLVDRLGRLETGQVSDVLDEAGLPFHALASDLLPLTPGMCCAGRALCARGEPRVQVERAEPPLPADALDNAVTPGSVVVIDAGGFVAGACLGGFVAYGFQRAGASGLIVAGAIRDADEIRGYGLPTFCRAVTPVNGARRWRMAEIGGTITLTGQAGVPVTVRTGDLVLADGDGIVVVPAAAAEAIVEDAERLAAIERRIGEEMRAGGARAAVFARNPRFAHIRKIAGG